MGFSLKAFFTELYDIMNDDCLDEEQERNKLIEAIENGCKYAEECGQLD